MANLVFLVACLVEDQHSLPSSTFVPESVGLYKNLDSWCGVSVVWCECVCECGVSVVWCECGVVCECSVV